MDACMKYDDLKEGMLVYVDDGFTCMDAGTRIVRKNESGFYLDCKEGKHYLVGQIEDDGETMIGVYRRNPNIRVRKKEPKTETERGYPTIKVAVNRIKPDHKLTGNQRFLAEIWTEKGILFSQILTLKECDMIRNAFNVRDKERHND